MHETLGAWAFRVSCFLRDRLAFIRPMVRF
jgi:hypothetical protein